MKERKSHQLLHAARRVSGSRNQRPLGPHQVVGTDAAGDESTLGELEAIANPLAAQGNQDYSEMAASSLPYHPKAPLGQEPMVDLVGRFTRRRNSQARRSQLAPAPSAAGTALDKAAAEDHAQGKAMFCLHQRSVQFQIQSNP